jgi:tripartite ATP-independent transporter DctP family solute receptor
MKKGMSLMFVVLLALMFYGAGNPGRVCAASGDEKPVTLKLCHNSHPESSTGKAISNWAKLLSDKTGGKLIIEIYPQNQLGGNKELSEQTALGLLDMHVQGMTMVDYKVEEGYLTKVPFLFRSSDHVYKWWTGPEGTAILKKVEARGVKVLTIDMIRMPRQFASRNKALVVPDDIKGLKVRAGEAASNQTLKVLEAVPTNVSLNEMYTALSQGMVDVVELPLDYIYDYSIFEVTKHLTLSNHVYDLQWLVINQKKFNSLPAGYQKLLVDSMAGLAKDNNTRQEALFGDILKKLKEKGMNVITTDRTKWEAVLPKVIPNLEKTWPSTKGLYDKIMKMK